MARADSAGACGVHSAHGHGALARAAARPSHVRYLARCLACLCRIPHDSVFDGFAARLSATSWPPLRSVCRGVAVILFSVLMNLIVCCSTACTTPTLRSLSNQSRFVLVSALRLLADATALHVLGCSLRALCIVPAERRQGQGDQVRGPAARELRTRLHH